MSSHFFLRSSYSILCTLSLLAVPLLTAQSGLAQTSLQIRDNGIVIQSGGQTMILNGSPSTGSSIRSSAMRSWSHSIRSPLRSPIYSQSTQDNWQSTSQNTSQNTSQSTDQRSTPDSSSVYSSSSSQVIQTTGGSAQVRSVQSGERSTIQQTVVTLSTSALRQPCILTVSIADGQLSGQVKIGNEVIRSLKGIQTTVDLAPYLSRGTSSIEIAGQYEPSRNSVKIAFSGGGSQVVQQSSGSGTFNHRLVVTVE